MGVNAIVGRGPSVADVGHRARDRYAGNWRMVAKDIGLQTEDVLTNGMPWDLAAAIHFQVNQRAAGNGSLMRASTSAVYFAAAGQEATMNAARRIAALTHGDRTTWEGTAIFHELIRDMFEEVDLLTALRDILAFVYPDHRGRYATVLAPDWRLHQATEFNGAVWLALPGLRRLGPAHHQQLRRRDSRGGRPRRRHGHRRRSDRRPCGGALRAGCNPRPLAPAAPCAPPRIRRTGAGSGRSAPPCVLPRKPNRVLPLAGTCTGQDGHPASNTQAALLRPPSGGSV